MKNIYLIFIVAFISVSCQKNNGRAENMCKVARFVFLDDSGKSIFDSLSYIHIDTSEFVIKNKAGDDQTYYTVFQDTDSSHYFEIFIYHDLSMISDLYFYFDTITVDTIKAHFKEKGSSTFIEKLYYNGALIEFKNHCESFTIHDIIVKPEQSNHL